MKFSKYILLGCTCLYFVRVSDSLAALANDGIDTSKLEEKDKQLQSQIEAQKAEIESLKTRVDESATEKPDIASITAKIESLENQIKELSTPEDQPDLTEKISALEAKSTELATLTEKQKEQIDVITNQLQASEAAEKVQNAELAKLKEATSNTNTSTQNMQPGIANQLSSLAQTGAGLLAQTAGAATQNTQPGIANQLSSLAQTGAGLLAQTAGAATQNTQPGIANQLSSLAQTGAGLLAQTAGAATQNMQPGIANQLSSLAQTGAGLLAQTAGAATQNIGNIQSNLANSVQNLATENQGQIINNPELITFHGVNPHLKDNSVIAHIYYQAKQGVKTIINSDIVKGTITPTDQEVSNAIFDKVQQGASLEYINKNIELVANGGQVMPSQQPVAQNITATNLTQNPENNAIAQQNQQAIDPSQQTVVANGGQVMPSQQQQPVAAQTPQSAVTVKEENSGKTYEIKEHALLVAKPVEYIDGVKITPISEKASDILKKSLN